MEDWRSLQGLLPPWAVLHGNPVWQARGPTGGTIIFW